MAEPTPFGMYDPTTVRGLHHDVDGGVLEVHGVAFGPAGASSIELPTGEVWTVDHADPDRLVGLEIDTDGADLDSLMLAAFGGDGALEVLDRAGAHDDVVVEPAPLEDPWSRRRRSGPAPTSAARFGRLVVLSDLASHPTLDPVARLVALAQLAEAAPHAEGAEVLERVVEELLHSIDELVAAGDPTVARTWRPKLAPRVAEALGDLSRHAARTDRLQRLQRELLRWADGADGRWAPRQHRPGHWEREYGVAAPADDEWFAAAPMVSDVASMPRARRAGPVLQRTGELVVEVRVPRDDETDRWVRLLRPDGFVPLAQAPLVRDQLSDMAELVVGPEVSIDELEVQVLDGQELVDATVDPLRVIREAVRAGRAAASAERAQDLPEAELRWMDCADAWAAAGDDTRARLAAMRASPSYVRRSPGTTPLLVDELDPFAVGREQS